MDVMIVSFDPGRGVSKSVITGYPLNVSCVIYKSVNSFFVKLEPVELENMIWVFPVSVNVIILF